MLCLANNDLGYREAYEWLRYEEASSSVIARGHQVFTFSKIDVRSAQKVVFRADEEKYRPTNQKTNESAQLGVREQYAVTKLLLLFVLFGL